MLLCMENVILQQGSAQKQLRRLQAGSAIVELRTSRFKAKFKMSASVMAACLSCLASAAGALSARRPNRAKMHTACEFRFAPSVPTPLSLCKYLQQQERSSAGSTSMTKKAQNALSPSFEFDVKIQSTWSKSRGLQQTQKTRSRLQQGQCATDLSGTGTNSQDLQ